MMGNLKGKRLLEKPKHRWEGYIKTNLGRNMIGMHGLDSCASGYRQMSGFFENSNELSCSTKCREFPD
jgi:hypothetical protein